MKKQYPKQIIWFGHGFGFTCTCGLVFYLLGDKANLPQIMALSFMVYTLIGITLYLPIDIITTKIKPRHDEIMWMIGAFSAVLACIAFALQSILT